jgi:hypothetical protein
MRKAKERIYMEKQIGKSASNAGNMNGKADDKNLPEKKFSTGVISATVWNNKAVQKDGQPGEYKTISLQRRYKDKAGVWQSTNYLRLNDLPKAALVLNKAYEYLVLRETAGNSPDEIPEEMVEDGY